MAILLAWSIVDHWHYTGWQGDDLQRYQNKVFTCVNVVDGDTVDIDAADDDYNHTRIRLWGVDTPEVAKSGRGEMFFGPEASDFAKHTLLNRKVRIELQLPRTRDRYGRVLAYVYLMETGELFNAVLVAQGYGYADTRFDHPHQAEFVALEQQAHQQRRGLWDGVRVDQMPKWRQKQRTPQP